MLCVVETSLGHALRRLFNSVEELRGAVRSKEARLLGANSNVSLQARKIGVQSDTAKYSSSSKLSVSFFLVGHTFQGLVNFKINNANGMIISCQDCVTLADRVQIGLVKANSKERKNT